MVQANATVDTSQRLEWVMRVTNDECGAEAYFKFKVEECDHSTDCASESFDWTADAGDKQW